MTNNETFEAFKRHCLFYLLTLMTVLLCSCDENQPKFRIVAMESPGIRKDALVLKEAIQKANKNADVTIEQLAKSNFDNATVNIFLQTINPSAIAHAQENWVVVNPEHVEKPETYGEIDRVLCKTYSCITHMAKFKKKYKFNYRVVYIGFTSTTPPPIDLQRKNWNLFFHGAGQSANRQTSAILNIWRRNPQFPKLLVTCLDVGQAGRYSDCAHRHLVGDNSIENIAKHKNIVLHTKFLPEEDFVSLQQSAGYVIAPSEGEGFGHYLNEARGLGSLVITTDFSPMNELIQPDFGFLVASKRIRSKGLLYIPFHAISEADLESAIRVAIATPQEQRIERAIKAMARFQSDKAEFENNVRDLITSVNPISGEDYSN